MMRLGNFCEISPIFEPRDLYVGIFWTIRHKFIALSKTSCGVRWEDSVEGKRYGERWLLLYVLLLPSLGLLVRWRLS